ncbi:MAG: 3-phosphoshikimate 1-carboxyvinyltransferase [Acidimicrobiales bacterium]
MLIERLAAPPHAALRVPGSKSLTNRALLCAALSDGTTVLPGALRADDTEAMADCLRRAGIDVTWGDDGVVVSSSGRLGAAGGPLDAQLSGTTSRFLLPVLAVSPGTWVLDGDAALRARPFGPLVDAVRQLGAEVHERGEPRSLPLEVVGAALAGGAVSVAGDVTSQFVSALLLAGPLLRDGLDVVVDGTMASAPYVAMTRHVMAAFGVVVDGLRVPSASYVSPGRYPIEPDASAASYFFGVAAVTGGSITLRDLGNGSQQGDVRFATDVLPRMGCTVVQDASSTTVRGPEARTLHGIDIDLGSMPDMAPTLAVIAVFGDGPTRVRGVQIIRGHETDRIRAVVNELRRLGIEAHEHDDGFTIVPGDPRSAIVSTYGDHRMAMAFTVLGLRTGGISIEDPGCVAKTFPKFYDVVAQLR